MGHQVWQSSNDQVPASTTECGQCLAQHGLHHPPSSCTHSLDQIAQVYQEHGIQIFTSLQMSAPDTEHCVEHAHMLPVIPHVSHMGSIYGLPHETFMPPLAYQPQQQQQQQDSTWKNFHEGFAYERLDVHHMGALSSGNSDHASTGTSSHCRHDLMHLEAPTVECTFTQRELKKTQDICFYRQQWKVVQVLWLASDGNMI
jgi:hypothetical protein